MSNVPEEPDFETAALIEKLKATPERDPRAAANGRAKFLAEARSYAASVTAHREQRPMEGRQNLMRLARVPIFLLLIAAISVAVFASTRTFLRAGYVYTSRSFQGQASQNVEVSVAGQNIPQGAIITEDGLATISLPQDKVSAMELTADEKSQLVGKVAKIPLEQGMVITSAMVDDTTLAFPLAGPAWPTAASGGTTLPQGGTFRNQMVVKNGEIRLLVKDTDRALDGVTQVVTDTQGYVISSRVWYQQDYYRANHKYATVTIGVPVDQFENALRRLRRLAIRVLDENASGDDVTGQYVDLQSQVTNLEATRDRIKSFLNQAKTVDEALRINQQLAEIEAQIETLKGQMNYLSNRSAFSTITVNLEPELPPIRPTPGLTPTPTPIAALAPWDPGKTTRQATNMLISVYRLIVDFFIWIFVVVVPILGPPALLIWLAGWLIRRRNRGAAEPGEPLTHA